MKVTKLEETVHQLSNRIERYDKKGEERFRTLEEKIDRLINNIDTRFTPLATTVEIRSDINQIENRIWGLVIGFLFAFFSSLFSLLVQFLGN
jgi:tetrahydromethanopterin S-methyltransferase subunit B